MQIVYLHEANSSHVVYTAHDRGVVTRWQICDDRRFSSVTGRVAPSLNLADLIAGDNPTDDGRCPVVIRGNQSSRAVVQLQCRISQCIRNAVLSELWPNGAHNHPLGYQPLNNKPSDHHVVPRLHEGATTDVGQN